MPFRNIALHWSNLVATGMSYSVLNPGKTCLPYNDGRKRRKLHGDIYAIAGVYHYISHLQANPQC